MTAYDLSPAFVKLSYVSNGRSHLATLPAQPSGTPVIGSPGSLLNNADNPLGLITAVTEYVTAVKTLFPATTTFTAFEFYTKEIGADPVFIYGDDLNIVGTNVSAVNPDNQAVLTWRTSLGNVAKSYFMETSVADDARLPLRASTVAPWGAIFTYMTGSTGWVRARDNGKLISGIFVTTKTNDALRKDRILNN